MLADAALGRMSLRFADLRAYGIEIVEDRAVSEQVACQAIVIQLQLSDGKTRGVRCEM